jgi:serine protease Do
VAHDHDADARALGFPIRAPLPAHRPRIGLGAAFAVLLIGWALGAAPALAQGETASDANPNNAAEHVYAAARPELLQIRTVLAATGQQTTLGSGFLVSADGLAITNYHVVSSYALEPETYRLEYATVDGQRGPLQVLALDIADDLALVRLPRSGAGFLHFDPRALGDLTKGERIFAMGNPLDIGFSIVEGTFNGLVDHSYTERIHFSGALNPGMSGGPAVTAGGKVVGINVAHQLGGELVSFLVPAHFAEALLARAGRSAPPAPGQLRGEIGRQLSAWVANFYAAIGKIELRPMPLGPYATAKIDAPWFTCWAATNAGQVPKPRAAVDTTRCNSDSRLFVSDDLNTGFVSLSQSLIRSVDLNQFQFAAFLSKEERLPWLGFASRKWFTRQRCSEDFTVTASGGGGLPVDAVWCARAYRKFDGLYDVAALSVTQDRGNLALVTRLGMHGVTYDDAIALTKRILAALGRAK